MATTFTKFLELPVEIRLSIWHFSLSLFSRIIVVKFFIGRSVDPLPPWEIILHKNSPLLSINREPREELLRSHIYFDLRNKTCVGRRLAFCRASDILYLNMKSLWRPDLRDYTLPNIFREIFGSGRRGILTKELRRMVGSTALWSRVIMRKE